MQLQLTVPVETQTGMQLQYSTHTRTLSYIYIFLGQTGGRDRKTKDRRERWIMYTLDTTQNLQFGTMTLFIG